MLWFIAQLPAQLGSWVVVATLVVMILALAAIAVFIGRDASAMDEAEHHGD